LLAKTAEERYQSALWAKSRFGILPVSSGKHLGLISDFPLAQPRYFPTNSNPQNFTADSEKLKLFCGI
jgi:hypothetical protein